MPQQKHGHCHRGCHDQNDVKACLGGIYNGLPIVLTVEMAHPDQHCRGNAKIHHIEQARHGDHNLMGCQCLGAYPSHKDRGKGKGCRLNAHLHRRGPSQHIELAKQGGICAHGKHIPAVGAVAAAKGKDQHKPRHHQHTRQGSRNSCAQQAPLGHTTQAIDKQGIAHNIGHIATHHHHHRHLGAPYCLEKLLEHIGDTGKGYRQHVDKQIGLHQRQQFSGLSQTVQVDIEQCRDCQQQHSQQQIGHQRCPQHPAYTAVLASPEMPAHNGREPHGEAQGKDNEKQKHGVDKGGSCQFTHTVPPYHQRIGKTEHHLSDVAHHDGHTQLQQGLVMTAVSVEQESCHCFVLSEVYFTLKYCSKQ